MPAHHVQLSISSEMQSSALAKCVMSALATNEAVL